MVKKADKLLADMRKTKAGWKFADLVTVYKGYGFTIKDGRGSHRVVKHPDFPKLRTVITDHSKELAPGYVRTLVSLIDELLELEGKTGENQE